MKKILILAGLVFAGGAGWSIADNLSPDALSMALGVLFGALAGLPAALLVLAGMRRRDAHSSTMEPAQQRPGYPSAGQPPVIVISPGAGGYAEQAPRMGSQGHATDWPRRSQAAPREFRVVGQDEEW